MAKKLKNKNSQLAAKRNNFWGSIWGKGIIALILSVIFFLFARSQINWLVKIKNAFGLLIGTFWWAIAGLLAGAMFYNLFKNK